MQVTVGNVTVEGSDQKSVFEQIANHTEIFGETMCGKCNGILLRYVVREVEKNKYYEIRCLNPKCRARLTFGVRKENGNLFPHRKNDDGSWKGNNGWAIYDKTDGKEK